MNQTEKILLEQLRRHSTHYIESSKRGIVCDDLDVDSFIEETSKLVTANGAEQGESNCNMPLVSFNEAVAVPSEGVAVAGCSYRLQDSCTFKGICCLNIDCDIRAKPATES